MRKSKSGLFLLSVIEVLFGRYNISGFTGLQRLWFLEQDGRRQENELAPTRRSTHF
jgi:hypothetical protein